MPKKGSGNGHLFPYSPILWKMGGRSFPRAFDRRVKFLSIMRKCIEEFERHVREDSGNGQLSPKRPPLGKMEGAGLPGILTDG